MNVLITLLGRSGWGLFNSVWGMIRIHGYVPEKVYIITDGCQVPLAEQVRTMLVVLLAEYGEHHQIEIVPLQGDMIREIATKVREIAEKEKKQGNTLALDVTPGTKSLVMGAVIPGMSRNLFDHMFYLYIETLRNASRPFIMIPLSVQHDHEFLKEVK
ncbi:MAG TPA: hypothetical protein VGK23_09860 [Methanomassiliicoccales archaeon]|jgi:hypothetical protein